MKVFIIKGVLGKLIPDNVQGFSLYPIGIFVQAEFYRGANEVKNHEFIHYSQQKELWGIVFYVWYLLEWVFRLVWSWGRLGYRRISFEREAYDNQDNYIYRYSRKKFSFIKYI